MAEGFDIERDGNRESLNKFKHGIRKEQLEEKHKKLFDIFDTNQNGTLEGNEVAALNKGMSAFAGEDFVFTQEENLRAKSVFSENFGIEDADFMGFSKSLSNAVNNIIETKEKKNPDGGKTITTKYMDGTVEEIVYYPDGDYKLKTVTQQSIKATYYTLPGDDHKYTQKELDKKIKDEYNKKGTDSKMEYSKFKRICQQDLLDKIEAEYNKNTKEVTADGKKTLMVNIFGKWEKSTPETHDRYVQLYLSKHGLKTEQDREKYYQEQYAKDVRQMPFEDYKDKFMAGVSTISTNIKIDSPKTETFHSERYKRELIQAEGNKIAQRLYDLAREYTGAVGEDEFVAELNKITKENVIAVIREYDKISPDESLFEMIYDEWASSDGDMKNALLGNSKEGVTGIFSTLVERARTSGVPTSTILHFEEQFKEQMDSDLGGVDSWFKIDPTKLEEVVYGLIQAIENKEMNDTVSLFLADTPTEELEKEATDVLTNYLNFAQNSFNQQLDNDGLFGEAADFISKIWGSNNTATKVRADFDALEGTGP